MDLTRFALDNARVVGLLTVLMMLAGVAVYMNFPSKEDPEVTVREAVVTASFPGMPPERIEKLISRKIEKAIRLIPEVEHVKSTSKTGLSITHVVVYDEFFDMKPIWQNLRNKMNDLRSELPEGTLGPQVDDEFGDVYVATIALVGSGFDLVEMHDVAKRLRDDIYTIDGTKKVVIHGHVPERIELVTTNARLARYGLSPDVLIQGLRDQNVILPGGTVDTGELAITIEPSGNFESLESIRRMPIELPNSGEIVYLEDIVEVRRGLVEPAPTRAYFDGQPAIVLAVSMMKGRNVLEFGPRLRAKVDELESSLPIGYRLEFATYQARYVAESVQGVALNVYETLGIVLAVVMFFLGVRTGLIVGTVVPMTMLVTLVVMHLVGIELQRVSLATLIIALGLLVDNGIVIAEEIGRRLREGEERRAAAIEAGQALALPLLTSSITTILAFMPLAMAPDDSGEYLRSMSQVILITLMASWLLAVCVTPLMCFRWLKPAEMTEEEIAHQYDGRLFVAYRRLLLVVMRRKEIFVVSVLGLLVLSLGLLQSIPQQFMPNSPRSQFMIYLDLPAGYGSSATQGEVERFAKWLADDEKNPEVTNSVAYAGYGGPRFFVPLSPRDLGENVAFVLVNTDSVESVDVVMERVRRHLFEEHATVFPRLKKFWLGTSETGLVKLRATGPDAERLAAIGEKIEALYRSVEGTVDIHNDWENRITKVRVAVDQTRARHAGISSRDVAASLNAFFSGESVTNFREGDKVIPIAFRADELERKRLDQLWNTNVYSTTREGNVSLLQVADIEEVTELSRIRRRDLSRAITISAKHAWLQAAELEAAMADDLDALRAELPPGYQIERDGETKDADDANTALGAYVPHALAAMIIILVWQFNSFLKPLIVFTTIPITFIGAIAGLWITGAYLGFMAILGFLSLAGIIINNAIVLLETTQTEIDAGAAPFDAVIGASISRFQPVMMTTLTTVLGLVPLMIPADPLFSGMAIVISFGIGVGTLLTLLIVPALYAILYRVPVPEEIAS